MTALFFRVLAEEHKDQALADAVVAVREGCGNSDVYAVQPASFRQVPGSPFAYWVSERIRRLFTDLPKFESEGRTVKQGLATADDFQFVRAWWEVPPERILDAHNGPDRCEDLSAFQEWCRKRTYQGKRWVPFAKGGEYSPYFADIHLVVNWERDGEEIRNFVDPETGRTYSRPQNTDFYFRPGLTWPLRAARFFPAALPAGSIFSVRGYAILAQSSHLAVLQGLGNSMPFDFLFKVMLGRFGFPEFIVGVLQQLPFPDLSGWAEHRLGELANECAGLRRQLDTTSETSRLFILPAFVQASRDRFAERISVWQSQLEERQNALNLRQYEIDDIIFELYGIDGDERRVIEEAPRIYREQVDEKKSKADGRANDLPDQSLGDTRWLVIDLLSYTIGCVFGRWHIRLATHESPEPELLDPFAPLPACSPGMLIGEDGLPATETPQDYPISIDWDGILVDDPDHQDDIIRRVRDVFELIWKERAESIEKEACEILGVKELRDYFRKPGKGGFWDDHIKRYSKSRRKAPIYWLLQSSKKNYALWLYYHRLDKDILFSTVVSFLSCSVS